jgi:hypothetical protein
MTARRNPGWLAVAIAGGCALDPYRFDTPRAAAGVELEPYALQEQCVELDRGQSFDFYFVSAAPIAFNIHYRNANAVIMPITRDNATRDSGVFTADHKDVYCIAWKAGVEPSILEYQLRPVLSR